MRLVRGGITTGSGNHPTNLSRRQSSFVRLFLNCCKQASLTMSAVSSIVVTHHCADSEKSAISLWLKKRQIHHQGSLVIFRVDFGPTHPSLRSRPRP